jgi:hypothetical protein
MIKGTIIHVYEIWLIRVLVIFIIFLLTIELISCYYSEFIIYHFIIYYEHVILVIMKK